MRRAKVRYEFEYRNKATGGAWRRADWSTDERGEPRSKAAAQWRLWRMLPSWTGGTNLRLVVITKAFGPVVRKRRHSK